VNAKREAATATHLDVVGDNGHVLEVERGVDLVHHVQRRGLVVVQRKDQRERREGLLAAGQVGNVLPALLGRAHGEDDALGEGVEGVDELELRVAAQRDHLVHLLQLQRDLAADTIRKCQG
jgi:hypothetical protein